MPKLTFFNFLSVDGYYKGPNEDISWNTHDDEWDEHSIAWLKERPTLVFGRVTYQLMAAYWPTPQSASNNPAVTDGMNNSPKIVFSRTLQKAEWNNTRIISGNMIEEMKKLKQQPGPDLIILGSGTIITPLAEAGLIDEFKILINHVVTGGGTPLFKGINRHLQLKLISTHVFKNGNVLLCYRP